MIEVPPAAIELAKRFQGFHRVPKHDPHRAYPYICPAGYPTIGFGHLCDLKHPPIAVVEAEDYLAQDLMTALNATLRYCPVLATEPAGRGDWRPSWILRSTSVRGGCRLQPCGAVSINATGKVPSVS